ncbi:hypothetical protein TNCV_227461 [Trichonephila clavipes]|nr:hypothetical protein TNCV_227461 [Trichonephila clavipes]
MAGNAFDNADFNCAKSVAVFCTNAEPCPGDDLSHWVSQVILFDCQYPPKTPVRSRTQKSTLLDFPGVINSIVVVKIPNPTDISLVMTGNTTHVHVEANNNILAANDTVSTHFLLRVELLVCS